MRIRTGVIAAMLFAGCFAAPAPARGGLDIDLGASIRIGDDTDLYFAISSRYFNRDRTVVERLAIRYSNPDDLAVSLYISKRSGRSADEIHMLRERGMSWWEISVRSGLQPDIWFVSVDRDPGPPYGKAYGHWKKHRRGQRGEWRLTDGQIRDLVAVRMMHEYYGMPVDAAMALRASGRGLEVLMAEEYKKRHGKKRGPASKGRGKKPKR
jgi:hypothetical protein